MGGGVRYAFEHPRRLRAAFVGCGGQAYRNLLPALAYAPVDLVATCDAEPGRAAAYARQFGAPRSYGDLGEMLARERPEAVFLATGYDAGGRPLYPAQAVEAMEAGCHVWMEKPPAASTAEVAAMHEASVRTGRKVAVGFMKMFSPAVVRVREILDDPGFGRVTSFSLRDPEMLPPRAARDDPARMVYFLDHVVHPASVIVRLMGPVRRIYVETASNGAAVVAVACRSGACGVLHMPWGQSGNCPKERLEVVGEGANVVVENNTRLTWYRPGHPGSGPFEYGRVADWTGPPGEAPLSWEMEAYSGQPLNMHVFYQGYASELIAFAECVLEDRPVRVAGLADAWHVLRFYEAFRDAGDGVVELGEPPEWTRPEPAPAAAPAALAAAG
jgi:predicted dehydrogenase